MKKLSYIFLAVILFPFMGIVSSCSEDSKEEDEFDKWQEKNEAVLTQWAATPAIRRF